MLVHANLEAAFSQIDCTEDRGIHRALDNYESKHGLGFSLKNRTSSQGLKMPDVFLAFGSERGWSDSERALLTNEKWEFAHLGNRVLRLEMAVVSGIAITADALNLWQGGTESSL